MSNVIYLHKYRPLTRIPPVTQYSAEYVRHAREIERMFREMEEAERFRHAVSTMHGFYADTIPSDVEEVS